MTIELRLAVLGAALTILGIAAWAVGADTAGARSTVHRAESTAYCLSGTMADGSRVRRGSVASNRHPLGTRIWIRGKGGPGGRHRWTVRDRIGHSSELDFWLPTCASANAWGRRHVTYQIGWRR